MSVSMSTELMAMLQDCGAPDSFAEYLTALGIINGNVLALFSPDETHYNQHLIDPFIHGTTIGTVDHKTDTHAYSTAAILTQIRTECILKQTAIMIKNKNVPQMPPMQAGTTPPEHSVAPNTLKPGVWHTQIRKFEMTQLNGEDRSFPAEILLGAETILSRLLHEHLISKQYTPLRIGEILQSRAYTSSGQVNRWAQQPKRQKFSIDSDNMLSTVAEEPWTPTTETAIADGLKAAKWAFIF